MQFLLILMLYKAKKEKIHCSRMILRFLLYLILIGSVAVIGGVFSPWAAFPSLLSCLKNAGSVTARPLHLCELSFDSFSISAHDSCMCTVNTDI